MPPKFSYIGYGESFKYVIIFKPRSRRRYRSKAPWYKQMLATCFVMQYRITEKLFPKKKKKEALQEESVKKNVSGWYYINSVFCII